jgi:sigma-E factor negative regulatory protein RseB
MRPALFRAGAKAAWTFAVFSLPLRSLAAEPAETLARAADAARNLTYQGVVLYRGEDEFDVLKVQHRFKDGSEREHLVALTGEPRQLLRMGSRLICILPRDQKVSIDRPAGMKNLLSQLSAEHLRRLAQWYEFRDQGGGRIAGRDCGGVAVLPRDQFRYGYEICADRETGLPLKVSMMGQRGEVMEQVMFTEVSFPEAIDDAAFDEPKIDDAKFRTVARDLPALDATPAPGGAGGDRPQVSFEKLPPGYRVVAREQRPLPGGVEGKVEHLLLSDGLSAVSVFSAIEQHGPDADKPFLSRLGPMEAYGRNSGSYHITIVGEVPSAAIRLIGDGVRPVIPELDSPPPAAGDNPPTPQ